MGSARPDAPRIGPIPSPARCRPPLGPEFGGSDPMIRAHPATCVNGDVPDDRVMRLVEVGVAILALGAATTLAQIR
jgi:hypothetical protein